MQSLSLKFAALSGALLMLVTACSPVTGNSLLTDKKADSNSLTVDKAPKSEELYMKVYSPTLNTLAANTKAEVSGECYTSTYPNSRIVAQIDGNYIGIVDTNPANSAANTATCVNGRFNFSINTGALASGQQHTIRIILQAFETSSLANPIVNDVQGTTKVTLTK